MTSNNTNRKIFYRDNDAIITPEESNIIINFIETIHPQKNRRRRGDIFIELRKIIDIHFDYWGIPIEYAEPIKRIQYVLQSIPNDTLQGL